MKLETLTSGRKVTQYKGRSIVVAKTEKGDWFAETVKRSKDAITGLVTYSPDTLHHLYDYNKTRKAAIEMVCYLIDEEV